MLLAQTALIPVAAALARFVEAHGAAAYAMNYPYWYGGGVPFRYLMGPLIPLAMVLIHKASGLSYFVIPLAGMVIGLGVGSVGWGVLAGAISGNRRLGAVTALVQVVLPWKYLSGWGLGETSAELAKMCVPWLLVLAWKDKRIGLMAGVVVMLLVNTSGTTLLVIGMLIIGILKNRDSDHLGLGKMLWPVGAAMGLMTLWYGPGYWWRLVQNPWIGGVTGGLVVVRLWEFARNWLPIVLAVGAVRLFGRNKTVWEQFAGLWLTAFVLMTIFRMTANVAFWQDWIGWVSEIEVGVGFLVGASLLLKQLRVLSVVGVGVISMATVMLGWGLGGTTANGLAGLEQLALIAGEKRVFLSGSTVWWANAYYDMYQIRGGADRVTVDQAWNTAAWEIREGAEAAKTLKALKELKVEYVLVHANESKQYYKDFKHLEKWDQIGQKVWEKDGDRIYLVI